MFELLKLRRQCAAQSQHNTCVSAGHLRDKSSVSSSWAEAVLFLSGFGADSEADSCGQRSLPGHAGWDDAPRLSAQLGARRGQREQQTDPGRSTWTQVR